MPIRNPGEKTSRFDKPTVEDVNPHLRIDALADREGEPIVARPVPLERIHPDPAQPRRTIPAHVRGAWDGDPQSIPALLEKWRTETIQRLQHPIDIHRLILQNDERILDIDDHDVGRNHTLANDPVVTGYLKIARLAASIHAEGLTNPITIARDGDAYRLETGERRTLAYHLLRAIIGDKYSAIPARINEKPDVWRQASENNNRDALNAISLARQLALLLIDLYTEDGESFAPYTALITPGGSDRPYYAQVSDGVKYRIPRGSGERIQSAMGLSSRRMLSAYRQLLTVPDRLWTLADTYDFAERRVRDIMSATDDAWWDDAAADSDVSLLKKLDNILTSPPSSSADMLPTGNISPTPPSPQPTVPAWQDTPRPINIEPSHTPIPGGRSGVNVTIGQRVTHNGLSTGRSTAPTQSHTPLKPIFAHGQRVAHESGRMGTVTEPTNANGELTVKFDDGESVTWLQGGFKPIPAALTEYDNLVIEYVTRQSGQSPEQIILIRNTDPGTWEFLCQQYDAAIESRSLANDVDTTATPLHRFEPATYAALEIALFLTDLIPGDEREEYRSIRDFMTNATDDYIRDVIESGTTRERFEEGLDKFTALTAAAVDTYLDAIHAYVNAITNRYHELESE